MKTCEWKRPKKPLNLENYTFDFRNPYILTPKQCCFTHQTLVFGKSNNIVSPPKQYCFIRGSQIFGKWKAKIWSFALWKEGDVNKSEGNKWKAKTESWTEEGCNRTAFIRHGEMKISRQATMCILRIAWEGLFWESGKSAPSSVSAGSLTYESLSEAFAVSQIFFCNLHFSFTTQKGN